MIDHTLAQQRRFMRAQVGLTFPVLFETTSKDGAMEGYTMNYTKVRVNDQTIQSGEIHDVKLTAAFDAYCEGELVK